MISEKGGSERKESFDKNEINVGRVQGNDLMLPKGNVSKHHARLLYRDGRFIVTDLKSTNGTYVNGRKIAQATIVREGDKIYIGDFVLRLITSEEALAADGTGGAPDGLPRNPTGNNVRPAGMPPLPGDTSMPGPGGGFPPLDAPPPPGLGASPPPPPPGLGMPPAPGMGAPPPPGLGAPPPPPGLGGGLGAPPPPPLGGSPFDALPRDNEPGAMPPPPPGLGAPPGLATAPPGPGAPPFPGAAQIPGPPPSAGGGAVAQAAAGAPAIARFPAPARLPNTLASAGAPAPAPAPLPARPPGTAPLPSTPNQGLARTPAGGGPASPAQIPLPRPSGPSSGVPSRLPPRETPAQAAKRLALVTLIDRIADATDLSALNASIFVDEQVVDRLGRTAREQASAMQSDGEIPEGLDAEMLVGDAMAELTGFGPIGTLLDDDDVSEIHCLRYDHVLAVRGGVFGASDVPLTSDEALRRIVWRLVQKSDEPPRPGESVIERRLSRGATMIALVPPASSSHALVIRKRRRLDLTLDDFVRLGGLSRAMATFLENCLQAHANVLVTGPSSLAASSFLAALTSSSPAGERICVLQEVDEFFVPNAHVTSIALSDVRARGEEAVRAAAKIHPDRVVVSQFAGHVAVSTLDAIGEGTDGVLAASVAPSLRQSVSRLVTQVTSLRPGTSLEAAREIVGEAFDIAVEVVPTADGRHRLLRLAEFAGSDAKGVVLRDIFTAADGGDGTFNATGVVPRVVAEFGNRGVKVDPNLFKRAASRG
ncbi:Flp pilus assembly complex ATPase component TadA [Pendulispora brunnea]|uniref:Flp pilus assembly complex ATPase component TadA n=1 Tax=Pendulispora brunnea TaxID=2905690 RepID=A0ABZ2KJ77_9BACT